jgi:hypothetical protein
MLTRSQVATAVPVNGQRLKQLPVLRRAFLERHANWIVVIGLLLLATALTVPHLPGAFWVDEIITVERAGAPIHGGPFSPAQIWEHTATTTYDQVPGYYMLVSVWGNFTGWSEFSTRALSLLVGLLGIAITYRLGKDLFSPLAGLAAATALTGSALFINFMHEGRNYALLVLLGAAAIWLYHRSITRQTGWWVKGALVITAAGLLYAHYFASLLVFSLCLYHLLFVPKNRQWWHMVLIMGLAGALFLPWFLTSFNVLSGAAAEPWRQDMKMTIPELIDELLSFFSNGNVALLLVVGAFSTHVWKMPERFIWFTLLGSVVLALAVNAWIGMLVSPKFLLYLWVPLALLFGIGTTYLARRQIPPAVILIPWLVVGIWTSINWKDDPIKYVAWDVLHDELANLVAEDDALVFHLHATHWDGAHNQARTHYFHDFPILPTLLWSWPHGTDDGYLNDARTAAEQATRIWSSYDPRFRPDRVSKFDSVMAEEGFGLCGRVIDTPVMAVDLLARPPADIFPLQFGSEQFAGEGIGMAVLGDIVQTASGHLLIPLGWQQGTAVPFYTYSYSLHLLDAHGALAQQADVGLPPNHEFRCQVVQLDVTQLAPGSYKLGLVVYDWQTGARLTAVDTIHDVRGDQISLGSVNIE